MGALNGYNEPDGNRRISYSCYLNQHSNKHIKERRENHRGPPKDQVREGPLILTYPRVMYLKGKKCQSIF